MAARAEAEALGFRQEWDSLGFFFWGGGGGV